MNVDQGKPTPAETVIEDDTIIDQPPAEAPQESTNPMARFDGDTLRAISVSDMGGAGIVAFLPRSMAEAMEFAKLMAASNSVPPHLRGNRGDCLAVVIQATRWGADPFAVGNKTYFVNNRMAYEAQLVAAVVNTSKVLDGRLQVSWQGTVGKAGFQCTVRGRIKGDADIHELIQEIDTITTRNSPLWKQAQRVQLAYYTMRAWSRLFTPEVLLGIYTPDELETNPGAPGTVTVIPPRPTKESVLAQAAEVQANEERVTGRPAADAPEADPEPEPETEPAHDNDTGEIIENQDNSVFIAAAGAIIDKINKAGSRKVLDNLVNVVAKNEIEALPEDYRAQVNKAADDKRAWFAR